MIDQFFGYNHNLKNGYGEFYDTKNITSSYFPMLSTRHRRGLFSVSGDIKGLFSKDKIAYIANGKLYYGGAEVTGLSFTGDKERTMISMGAYLIIFPDKVYVNTAKLSDYGSLEAKFVTSGTVTYSLSKIDGTGYTYTGTKPLEPEDGDVWLDDDTLKEYSDYSSSWVNILTTYIKIASPNIGKAFEQYDGVKISGSSDDYFNNTFIIQSKGDDFIVVIGLKSNFSQTTPLTISRETPDIDFLCEGENRIWGCNSKKNEIYACKLGDFKNWNCFGGLSTDSYAVTVGSDGDFTGAIRYMSSILFFKENYIHKIYNLNPPYNVTTSFTKGVQKGSNKSLCVVNGSLFFMSSTGVCRYEGSLTVPLNNVFGTIYYHSGVAGEFRNKYYICLSSGANKRELFVYDTQKGLWHKEDEIDISHFSTNNSNLYYVYKDGVKKLAMIDSEQPYGTFTGQLSGYLQESDIEWSAETGLLGLDLEGYKYIRAMSVRLSITPISNVGRVDISVEYDSSGKWELLDTIEAQKVHGAALRLSLNRRCDHIRLKLSGKGHCKVYSITLDVEEGSRYGR